MQSEEILVKKASALFQIPGEYSRHELITDGHINTTYQVYFTNNGEEKDYILQKINTYVFKNPIEVMQNIAFVTEFIRKKLEKTTSDIERSVLCYAKTKDGTCYAHDENGGFWRCCQFVGNSKCFLQTDDLVVIEEAGKAFGEFQGYLSDFSVKRLNIVIPHFHNTVNRYELFQQAIEQDECGRAASVKKEIEAYFEKQEMATKLYRLQQKGVLPLRVTHNDTKISNVLFDKQTKRHLTVIDLDTVMPGLVACDFGDAIRTVASTCEEDEKDLSKVRLDMDKYEAFSRGFVTTVKDALNEDEKNTLALGAFAMTVECGMRFLTDYLNGDKYFKIHYPDQNLVRARCQLALACDMIERLEEMQEIVYQYCK